ncbi:hypothetical protein A2V82_09165 [candidate division KSB1 bacterium RBG_16_48_16]|nr:MAG: hypothetical protein A2V82_09165 [candidate division KSB1 bacterium RBG_16_48_16]
MPSFSRAWLWIVAFPLILLISIASCNKNQSHQTDLTFWAMGAEGESIEKLLPQLTQRHPDIKVKVQSIPWQPAHEKLLTAFAGGSTPDVCQLGNTWIPEFQAMRALLPLDSLVAQSSAIKPEDFFAGVWNTNVIGEKPYGIPWYVDTRVLFYRKDILESVGYQQAPRTWDEWLDACRKIKRQAGAEQKYAIFFSLIFNEWRAPVVLILSNGGRLLRDDDCYGAFDEPATLEAMRFYTTFFAEGLAPRNMTEVINVFQGFSTGFFSMMITGPWDVQEMRKRAAELTGKWSTAPMPRKENSSSTAGGSSLVIFKNTKNPSAAWKLIEFLSQPETQIEFFRLTRDLPAVRSAWNAPEIKADAEIQAFYQQLENVVPTPKIAEWEQIAVKIQEHLERVIFGQVALEDMARQLNRDVDRILEKRRWLLTKGLIEN